MATELSITQILSAKPMDGPHCGEGLPHNSAGKHGGTNQFRFARGLSELTEAVCISHSTLKQNAKASASHLWVFTQGQRKKRQSVVVPSGSVSFKKRKPLLSHHFHPTCRYSRDSSLSSSETDVLLPRLRRSRPIDYDHSLRPLLSCTETDM